MKFVKVKKLIRNVATEVLVDEDATEKLKQLPLDRQHYNNKLTVRQRKETDHVGGRSIARMLYGDQYFAARHIATDTCDLRRSAFQIAKKSTTTAALGQSRDDQQDANVSNHAPSYVNVELEGNTVMLTVDADVAAAARSLTYASNVKTGKLTIANQGPGSSRVGSRSIAYLLYGEDYFRARHRGHSRYDLRRRAFKRVKNPSNQDQLGEKRYDGEPRKKHPGARSQVVRWAQPNGKVHLFAANVLKDGVPSNVYILRSKTGCASAYLTTDADAPSLDGIHIYAGKKGRFYLQPQCVGNGGYSLAVFLYGDQYMNARHIGTSTYDLRRSAYRVVKRNK